MAVAPLLAIAFSSQMVFSPFRGLSLSARFFFLYFASLIKETDNVEARLLELFEL